MKKGIGKFLSAITLLKLLPASDQWSISLLKNINIFFSSLFMMLFLFSIFSFSVTARQIPSHSYISVSLFHFHLSCCRNHFLFHCHYLDNGMEAHGTGFSESVTLSSPFKHHVHQSYSPLDSLLRPPVTFTFKLWFKL